MAVRAVQKVQPQCCVMAKSRVSTPALLAHDELSRILPNDLARQRRPGYRANTRSRGLRRWQPTEVSRLGFQWPDSASRPWPSCTALMCSSADRYVLMCVALRDRLVATAWKLAHTVRFGPSLRASCTPRIAQRYPWLMVWWHCTV